MRCLREVRLVRTLVTDRVLLGYDAMSKRGKISTHTGYRPYYWGTLLCLREVRLVRTLVTDRVLLGYDAMSKRGKISS